MEYLISKKFMGDQWEAIYAAVLVDGEAKCYELKRWRFADGRWHRVHVDRKGGVAGFAKWLTELPGIAELIQ